jgi:hypothetical protein
MATLTIPDDLYERLRAAARREQRPVEEAPAFCNRAIDTPIRQIGG